MEQRFILRDVMYVEALRSNLLSVSKLTDKGFKVIFDKTRPEL